MRLALVMMILPLRSVSEERSIEIISAVKFAIGEGTFLKAHIRIRA